MKININMDELSKPGLRTTPGESVKRLAKMVEDDSKTEEQILNILKVMAEEIPLIQDARDDKKFKRSAEQICWDKYRNGCCDSSTLFVTICRERGIPAFQIITAKLSALKEENYGPGHFFSACFIEGEKKWIIVESNVTSKALIKGIKKYRYNQATNCIRGDFIVIAPINDYSNFEMSGVRINSIRDMKMIHQIFWEKYRAVPSQEAPGDKDR